jgi:hypothetical protein
MSSEIPLILVPILFLLLFEYADVHGGAEKFKILEDLDAKIYRYCIVTGTCEI